MIKVKIVQDWQMAFWVTVNVGDMTSAEYGPMSEEEMKAMIKGMKAFAAPHIVLFDDV